MEDTTGRWRWDQRVASKSKKTDDLRFFSPSKLDQSNDLGHGLDVIVRQNHLWFVIFVIFISYLKKSNQLSNPSLANIHMKLSCLHKDSYEEEENLVCTWCVHFRQRIKFTTGCDNMRNLYHGCQTTSKFLTIQDDLSIWLWEISICGVHSHDYRKFLLLNNLKSSKTSIKHGGEKIPQSRMIQFPN